MSKRKSYLDLIEKMYGKDFGISSDLELAKRLSKNKAYKSLAGVLLGYKKYKLLISKK